MSRLLTGLSVAAIGILVVFVGLVILIGFIKLLNLFMSIGKKKKAAVPAPKAEAAAPAAAQAAVQPAEQAGVSGEVLAAITAAIAAVWQGETGFVVRRVRRVSNASAWNRAGHDEQVYSRL